MSDEPSAGGSDIASKVGGSCDELFQELLSLQGRLVQAYAHEVSALRDEVERLSAAPPSEEPPAAQDEDNIDSEGDRGPMPSVELYKKKVLAPRPGPLCPRLPTLLGDDPADIANVDATEAASDVGGSMDYYASKQFGTRTDSQDSTFSVRSDLPLPPRRSSVLKLSRSEGRMTRGFRSSFQQRTFSEENITHGMSRLDRIANMAAEGSHASLPIGSEMSAKGCRNWCPHTSIIVDSGMGCVIVLNAIVLGISCDLSPEWPGWTAIDLGFALIFFAEVIAQCGWRGCSTYFSGTDKRWHTFEVVLVILALFEVLIKMLMPMPDPEAASAFTMAMVKWLRVLRFARIARVGRLPLCKELSVLITGTLGGMRTLGFSTVLLALPLYLSALVFRETLGDQKDKGSGAEMFETLPTAIFTLFRCIVAADCNEETGKPIFVHVTARYGWGYGMLYSGLVFFMTLGLFNVIAAIFVENVVIGAKTNERLLRQQRLRDKAFYAGKIFELVELIVEAGKEHSRGTNKPRALTVSQIIEQGKELKLTPVIFERLRHNSRFTEILSDLDVADDEHFDLFETLDTDGSGCVDVEELVDGISHLRGEARRSDVVSLNFLLRNSHMELRKLMDHNFKLMRDSMRESTGAELERGNSGISVVDKGV